MRAARPGRLIRRSRLTVAVKVAVSAGLLAYALRAADLEAAAGFLAQADLRFLPALLLAIFAERATMVHRWLLLLRSLGQPLPFWGVFKVLLVSNSLGSFSPGGVAVDALRVYGATARASQAPAVLGTVLADRFFGAAALLLLGAAAAAATYRSVPAVRPLAAGILLGLAVLVGLFLAAWRLPLGRWIERSGHPFLAARADQVLAAWRALGDRGLMGRSLGWALLLQLQRIAITLLVARALGIGLPAVFFFLLCPIAFSLRQLPISIGGLGLSQGLYVGLFATVGLPASEALALSLATEALHYLMVGVGALVYLTRGLRTAAPAETGP